MKAYMKNGFVVLAGFGLAAIAVFHDLAARDRAWLRMTLGESRYTALEPVRQWLTGAGAALERFGLIGVVEVDVEPGVRLQLDPWDRVDRTILLTGSREPDSWEAIAKNLPDGGTFVDVGAHGGY
jgi:hypothetical protein